MGSKEVLRTKTLPFITAILRERGRECQNYVGFWPVQALARVRTNTLLAPAEINISAQADTVAPVVNTSSTSRISSPATSLGWVTTNAPATVSRRPFTSRPARYFSGEETLTRLTSSSGNPSAFDTVSAITEA